MLRKKQSQVLRLDVVGLRSKLQKFVFLQIDVCKIPGSSPFPSKAVQMLSYSFAMV